MSYKCFLYYLFLIFKVLAEISIKDKGIFPLEKNSVAIKFFVDIEIQNRTGTCKVFSRVKKCCLTDLDKEDCDVMDVVDETIDVIKPRDRKTITYVYPTLCPYDLVGYCNVILDYHCLKNRDRLHVNIPFDTRFSHNKRCALLETYLSSVTSEQCDTLDQNSLDNCLPIDCDVKYAGQRSFYDTSVNRCTKIPICIGDPKKELPSVVYVPHINVCKNLELPLTVQDIYAITTGLGTITQSTKKEEDVKVELKSNCSTISQNLYLLRDLMYGKLCPCCTTGKINFEDGCKSAILAIVFCVISICAVIFSFILCVNTTVWVHRQWSKGNVNALFVRVKSKFRRTEKKHHRSRINSEIRNTLLREVIVKDIPLELRDSVVNICNRMEKEVKKKKRYRNKDLGSQISLQKEVAVLTSSSTDTLCSEKDSLLK